MRRGGWIGRILIIVLVLFLLFSLSSVFSEHEPDLLDGQERWSPQMEPEWEDEETEPPEETVPETEVSEPEPAEEIVPDEEQPASETETEEETEVEEEAQEEVSGFEIQFLDVGQADAALVLCDGHAMMIDGGKTADSQKTYAYLADHQIDHLDYVVCTHPHDDHAGGLAGALNYATADFALCPVTEYDTVAFRNFTKYLDRQGVAITVPAAGDVFSFGSAEFTILGPVGNPEKVNDSSIVLKIRYGDTTFLFTGDAEREEEQAILDAGADLKSTVLKVGHHGGDSSTTYPFLREIMPEYAVISVGKDNTYGHPEEDTLARLKDAGVELYRTDLQGTIVCRSDGTSVSFQTERTAASDLFAHPEKPAEIVPITPAETPVEEADDRAVLEPVQPDDPDADRPVQENKYTYILNTNTYVFHEPYCPSVGQMSEKNKKVYVGTRDEIIEMGFRPCERCYP